MVLNCSQCARGFRAAASLNFHIRKAHGGRTSPPTQVTSNKRSAQDEGTEPRPSQPVRPTILKFSSIPGMRDYTKGPFKISRIALRIAEDKEKVADSKSPCARDNRAIKRKASAPPPPPQESQSDEDDESELDPSSILPSPPPSNPLSTTPTRPELGDMPVLTPHRSQSPCLGGRPGPKRSKRGTHWKYNQDDTDTKSSDKPVQPTPPVRKPSRRILNYSDDATPPLAASNASHPPRPVSQTSTSSSSASEKASAPPPPKKRGRPRINKATTAKSSVIVSSDASPPSSSSYNTTTTPPPPPKNANKKRAPPLRKPANDLPPISPTSRVPSKPSSTTSSSATATSSTSTQSKPAKKTPFYSGKGQECPACGKTGFRNVSRYMNHLEIHEGLRPFLCPIPACEMGFETEIKLIEHVTIRHGTLEAAFTCSECEHEFKTQRGLLNHKCSKPTNN